MESMDISNYEKRGNHWYRIGDSKKPYDLRNCEHCGSEFMGRRDKPGKWCSVRCSKQGKNNPQWQGEDAGYMAAHGRVYRARGSATRCIFGDDHKGPYDWANLMGDYPDVADYTEMCRSCHAAFDGAKLKCFDYICPQGHSFERDGYYSRITAKGEVRQCKQCGKDRARKKRNNGRVD